MNNSPFITKNDANPLQFSKTHSASYHFHGPLNCSLLFKSFAQNKKWTE